MVPKPGPPWLKTMGSTAGSALSEGRMATANRRLGPLASACSSRTMSVPHFTSWPSIAPAGRSARHGPGSKRGTSLAGKGALGAPAATGAARAAAKSPLRRRRAAAKSKEKIVWLASYRVILQLAAGSGKAAHHCHSRTCRNCAEETPFPLASIACKLFGGRAAATTTGSKESAACQPCTRRPSPHLPIWLNAAPGQSVI